MTESYDLCSPEDFRKEAEHCRNWAKKSGNFALISAGLSGTIGTMGIAAFINGGPNVINGVLASGVSVGLALSAKNGANDVVKSAMDAQYYEHQAEAAELHKVSTDE